MKKFLLLLFVLVYYTIILSSYSTIFPNPSDGTCTYTIYTTHPLSYLSNSVNIYNIKGKEIKDIKWTRFIFNNKVSYVLITNKMKSGVYILKIGNTTKKFTILK